MSLMRFLITLLFCLFLASCSTTRVGMTYSPTAGAQTLGGLRPIEVGSFIDQRGEPANWLGAIRGGFGNPIKTLESDIPVGTLVQSAFTSALQSRGADVTGSTSEVLLTGVVKQLFCNQVISREANVEIEIQVQDVASKRVLFTRTYAATNFEGTLATGVFGSTDSLRALTEKTLREVVEQALNDSTLRLALAR